MALKKLFQRFDFPDANLNSVMQDYRRKMNEVIDYFLDTDFGNLSLYDTDKSDVLNLKWNEDDSNPRDLNFKVNKANRTINMSGNLTVEGASLINSDLTTDANWATTGTITGANLIVSQNSDTMTLSHNGTSAYCRWSDGSLILITDEGTNANTTLELQGKGTGYGRLRMFDDDNAEYIDFYASGSYGYLRMRGTTPSGLRLQVGEPQDISCWAGISTGNPYFYIYGWDAGLGTPAVQYMRMNIDASGDGVIDIQSGDLLIPNGSIIKGNLTLADGSITDSGGTITFVNENLDTSGYIALKSNAELRFYDNGNYVGFEAPALGGDCIWVLPIADGGAGEHITTDGSKVLSFTTGAGTGDVSALANFGTDNVLIRSNDVAKQVQSTGIVIDDSDHFNTPGNILVARERPTINLTGTGFDGSARIAQYADAVAYLAGNIKYDGSDWVLDDTSATGTVLDLGGTVPFRVRQASAGAGARSLTSLIECDTSGNFTISGNITLSSATSTITGGAVLKILAGASGVGSETVYDDTTANAANVTILGAANYIFSRSTSAKKYKDNITDLGVISSLIYSLRPVSFNSKCKNDDKNKRYYGLIADEVAEILPDVVQYNENNEAESYDNQMLITLLLAEIQNIRQELDSLKSKVKDDK